MDRVINHILFQDGEARLTNHPHLKAEMVARLYLGEGYTLMDVMEQYEISASDVYAALTYYYDNQAALDDRYNRIEREIRENATSAHQLLQSLRGRQTDSR